MVRHCRFFSRRRATAARLLVCAAIAGGAAAAWADEPSGIISPDAFHAVADLRLVGADGEQSWLDGGFGKTRFGGTQSDRDFRVKPYAIEGDLIWQPKFRWDLSGTVVGSLQRGQEHTIDLSEAYVTYKPLLPGETKLTVRAGLYWPPVSLEHGGAEWRVIDTITPSAINSWIGEEVKVVGTEATVTTMIGDHRLSATASLFGFNDTAGTEIAFRGWALHDEKSTAFGRQPLPPLNEFFEYAQAPSTRPVIEIDNRVGYYAKLAWAPPGPFEFQAFHYDNRGDPEAVTPTLQWGWRTHFNVLSASLNGEKFKLKAQALDGCTEMGFVENGKIWIDTDFRSAYLMATRSFERGSVSARIEAFGTRNHGSELTPEDNEDGWALTAAARRAFSDHAEVLLEALHVESSRDSRSRVGLPPHQDQNVLQAALRLHI